MTSIGREPSHSISHNERLSLDGAWDFELLGSPNQQPNGPFRSITVPGAWTMQETGDLPIYLDARMPFPEAPPHVPTANPTGFYRRTIEIPNEWMGRRIILHVGAAESVLIARVNGEEIGLSKDSHLAAEFDITPVAVPGVNLIELTVIKWSDSSFIEDQDQWWHGGLTRSVYLFTTPTVYLQDVKILADYDPDTGTGLLGISTTVGSLSGVISDGLTVRALLDGREVIASTDVPTHGRKSHVMDSTSDDGTSEMRSIWNLIGLAGVGVELSDFDRRLADEMRDAAFPGAVGVSAASVEVDSVEPWSAELPHLHELTVELVGDNGWTIDSAQWRIGFRRVQIVGPDLLVNGKRIWIHGVNRHDFDPHTGRTLTEAQLREQLALLKRFNINAIRTSHYPNDPAFLDLADEFGFYVVDEADIESHGWYGSVCDDPRYRDAFVDRVGRMIQRDRNHPSVFMWSLGNESGSGTNHDAAAGWARAADPSRPIHYEGAIARDWYGGQSQTDVSCPMYPSIEALAAYGAAGQTIRPLIMCEYQHAMGNSNGSLDDYWAVIRSTPGLQGGFIWELWDHGLDPDHDGHYRYGGDFGETDHDGNFCIDGLLFPDGIPHPAMYELRRIFSPVDLAGSAEEVSRGILKVRNTQSFADFTNLSLELILVSVHDTVSVGMVEASAAAGETVELRLAPKVVTALADPRILGLRVRVTTTAPTPWAIAGTELAQLQTNLRENVEVLPSRTTGAVAVDATGIAAHPLFSKGPTLSFWRAPTDNDRSRFASAGFRLAGLENPIRELVTIIPQDDSSTIAVESIYRSTGGHVIRHTQAIHAAADGALTFDETVVVPSELNDIARVGIVFDIAPGFEDVAWVGDGPHECYSDRRSSAMLGRWASTVSQLQVPYIRPQENGARTSITRLELQSPQETILITAPQPLQASVTHHRDEALADTAHWWELGAGESTVVHLDIAHRGLGTASVGPDVEPRFRVRAGTYRWSWSINVGAR
ncbi:MAG TPA: glycoside hydrolase family 2 TIM barrel-domain containing protein [Galbitalea sp.]|nr:glycoside hydrolase family 2 TIM barrel-domain containing protein [Galbitalea sp.]